MSSGQSGHERASRASDSDIATISGWVAADPQEAPHGILTRPKVIGQVAIDDDHRTAPIGRCEVPAALHLNSQDTKIGVGVKGKHGSVAIEASQTLPFRRACYN